MYGILWGNKPVAVHGIHGIHGIYFQRGWEKHRVWKRMGQHVYPLVICHIANWQITIEIVDVSIENSDFPWLC